MQECNMNKRGPPSWDPAEGVAAKQINTGEEEAREEPAPQIPKVRVIGTVSKSGSMIHREKTTSTANGDEAK